MKKLNYDERSPMPGLEPEMPAQLERTVTTICHNDLPEVEE